jgi:hypothetical protein
LYYLDRGGMCKGVAPDVTGRARGQQMQHRSQPLAAAADDVFGDLVDQHHVRGEARADQVVDRGHVGGDEGLHAGETGGGAGGGGGVWAQGRGRPDGEPQV